MSLPDLMLPVLRCFPAETAHRMTVRALSLGLGLGRVEQPDLCLFTTVFGLHFPTPVGIAAGFDKDAEAAFSAFRLGFGFVEVGTLTPRPQTGNPKPRLFRLPEDEAVINRMGFNNGGAEAAAKRLAKLRQKHLPGPLGVNIGKNKETEDAAADYARATEILAPYADYLTINVSSPNTPGLRSLQTLDTLRELVESVRAAAVRDDTWPPILIKIAPDLGQADLEEIAELAEDPRVAGLIISNTTIGRPDSLKGAAKGQIGGLSGKPLFDRSTEVLREMYRLTDGAIPLIGVGGIASAEDAYAKIRAGASLVQLYSALVYQGPRLVQRITQALPGLLHADGFHHLTEAIGADHR